MPPERLKTAFAGDEARLPPTRTRARLMFPRQSIRPPYAPPVKVFLNYFRCIAGEDQDLGRILDTLDEFGLADNTMVVYTSDNGYYLGDHGLSDKRSAYDESMRIPLLLRYPKLHVKGAVVDESVLNIDLAPTFLDFASLVVPSTMQGRSWRPLLTRRAGGAPAWRHSCFYEYFYERNFAIPTLFALRTDTAKLIKYKDHDEWTELFDLANDPYEMNNLMRDPSSGDFRARLEADIRRARSLASGFVQPAYADPDVFGVKKTVTGAVLEFRFDKDVGDKVVDVSGAGNNGKSKGAELAGGRDGEKARRFDGESCIDVPKSNTLNPALQTDQVRLAGLCHDRADVGHRGVVVVPDNFAPVDASLGIAPGDHRLDRVAHLLVQPGAAREAAIVAIADVDGGVGHPLVGGAGRVPFAARRRQCPERRRRRRRGPAGPRGQQHPVAVSEKSNKAAPAARMPVILAMAEPPFTQPGVCVWTPQNPDPVCVCCGTIAIRHPEFWRFGYRCDCC